MVTPVDATPGQRAVQGHHMKRKCPVWMKPGNPLTSLRHALVQPGPAMHILCYKLTSQQLQIYTVILKTHPMIAAVLGLTLSSYLQNTVVGSSTSAVIDSILICDGVSVTSGCVDLYCISSHYYGRKCPSG